ncbi:hypothetical protein ACIQPQ_31490 [Streptomyces sp. NPDC091281]|uniref:hypothetical protein n=1 Tax=Streptomyces sp. NPDC091281 TaxID=3365985 RepID=UPI003807FB5C
MTGSDIPAMRRQLLEAMYFTSEDRYVTAWMPGLSQALHEEGGIWELVGRSIGWPVGEPEAWVWKSWDEAARIYAAPRPPAHERPTP